MNFLVCKLCSFTCADESPESLGMAQLRGVISDKAPRPGYVVERVRAGGWLCPDCVREVADLQATPVDIAAARAALEKIWFLASPSPNDKYPITTEGLGQIRALCSAALEGKPGAPLEMFHLLAEAVPVLRACEESMPVRRMPELRSLAKRTAAVLKITHPEAAGSGGPATTGSAPEESPPPPPGESSGGSSAVTAGERRGAAEALDLEAIRARANAATPGPWTVQPGHDDDFYAVAGDYFMDANNEADAAFVAHAREDVPALCDALRVARVPHMALLIEAARRTCGPADEPTTASERAFVALDDAIDDALLDPLTTDDVKRRFDALRVAVWSALADEIHPLHELVKANGACVCPPDKPEATR